MVVQLTATNVDLLLKIKTTQNKNTKYSGFKYDLKFSFRPYPPGSCRFTRVTGHQKKEGPMTEYPGHRPLDRESAFALGIGTILAYCCFVLQ